MAILGVHTSIAGGYHKAIERSARLGCECVQLFTKNCNQWGAKRTTQEEALWFRRAVIESKLAPFRHLLNDRRFRGIPMILETPKGVEGGQDLDAINLRVIRGLAG